VHFSALPKVLAGSDAEKDQIDEQRQKLKRDTALKVLRIIKILERKGGQEQRVNLYLSKLAKAGIKIKRKEG
jgi:hypothetical protein